MNEADADCAHRVAPNLVRPPDLMSPGVTKRSTRVIYWSNCRRRSRPHSQCGNLHAVTETCCVKAVCESEPKSQAGPAPGTNAQEKATAADQASGHGCHHGELQFRAGSGCRGLRSACSRPVIGYLGYTCCSMLTTSSNRAPAANCECAQQPGVW